MGILWIMSESDVTSFSVGTDDDLLCVSRAGSHWGRYFIILERLDTSLTMTRSDDEWGWIFKVIRDYLVVVQIWKDNGTEIKIILKCYWLYIYIYIFIYNEEFVNWKIFSDIHIKKNWSWIRSRLRYYIMKINYRNQFFFCKLIFYSNTQIYLNIEHKFDSEWVRLDRTEYLFHRSYESFLIQTCKVDHEFFNFLFIEDTNYRRFFFTQNY